MCRVDRQQQKPFAYESKDLLALTAFIGRQSRGAPIAVADDEQTRKFVESGRAAFTRRQGQLNLSCAQCHDDNFSGRLAGSPVTQGQPTGYPIYRLEWQNLGSLHRRLRNCLTGMRAVTPALGAAGPRRARALSDVARARHAAGDAGGEALALSSPGLRTLNPSS